ncbi:MAG TPA: tautomerase family protein [Azospira sp.]|nr:tautomerase family protein [Azospira sp.]
MPFIRITLGREVSPEQRNALARRSTDLIVELLGKRREVTAVLVESAVAASWLIGGQPAAATPCHCEIAITEGSNTPEEIARMIAATSALLRETLAGTAEASYVVIRELPAGNWGYDGRTQAARRSGGAL